MKSSGSSKIGLVDTSFWFALLDKQETAHKHAVQNQERLSSLAYIVPWPVLYETLGTRFVNDPQRLKQFESHLKRPRVILLDDSEYRKAAYETTMQEQDRRHLSLVDNILRMIIKDRSRRVGYLFTFDVRDFADICRQYSVEIIGPFSTR